MSPRAVKEKPQTPASTCVFQNMSKILRNLVRHFTSYPQNMTKFLKIGGDEYIAYHHTPGKSPGVVFLPGLMSHMNGTKALALESLCKDVGHSYTRFDYRGHGESSGKHADATIGARKEDALTVLKSVAKGPQILVGSSLGGWIMLLVARETPEQISGLVGVACAADFISRRFDSLPEDIKTQIHTTGSWTFPSNYSEESYILSWKVVEEGRQHELVDQIGIRCPVRLIHGMKDLDVPYSVSLDVCKQLESDDVTVTLIKEGDHRLSDSKNLNLILKTVRGLILHVSE